MADSPTRPALSVGEAFPREQERVRELLIEYDKLGPVGAFGALMLRDTLARADAAMASGDVIAILRSYEELRGCQ
ncbi:MAG: hypothetical protein WC700_02230 [Gemmatimonadaceae bacterium]|jgi:hypothetical protein